MNRALLIAAMLLPAAAHADPISVFAAVLATTGSAAFAGGVAAVTSFLAANAFAVGLVAVNVFGAASGRRKARKAAALQRAEYNASLQDRSVTTLSANPPWRIVYGRCITGGDIVAIFTTDKTGTRPNGSTYTKPDALKHLVIVLAAHQVQAINEVFIDGVALGALDGSGWVTTGEFYKAGEATFRTVSIAPGGNYNAGTVVTVLDAWYTVGAGLEATTYPVTVTLTSGNTVINNGSAQTVEVRYTINATAARVRVSKQLGTDTQTVDTYLNSVAPTQWDSSCRLRGLAYVVLTLDLEEPRFQGGPPNVTFDVSGRLALDPRTATTAWTQNPAVLVRDFLTSPWGYACSSTDIDTTLHNAAANACDVAISLDVGGVVTTGQPTYTCNGAFTTADSREAVLEDLCESMAGFASYGATWGIVAGAWTAPVMTLTDDDLDGQLEVVQAGAGMEALFNGLRGQYIAAGKATPSDFDSYANAAFVAADGQALWSDIALPFTNNKARARNLARVFVERNRDGLVIRYPAKLRAWPLQIGDRVTVTSAEYGFSAKPFRVTDWQFGATTAVQLTLQEDAAAVYDLADAATADPAPNTALPNPWLVTALTSVVAYSGPDTVLKSGTQAVSPRILVTWAAVTDAYVAEDGGVIELYWRRPVGQWVQQNVPGDATSAYLIGVAHGEPTLVAARARNSLGAVGPFVYVAHVVQGLLHSSNAGGNMLVNPCFMDKVLLPWAVTASTLSGAVVSTTDIWAGAYNLDTRETGYILKPSAGGTDTQYVDVSPAPAGLVATPGRWFQFSIWACQLFSGAQIYCEFRNSAGAIIGYGGNTAAAYSTMSAGGSSTAWRAQPGDDGQAQYQANYAKLWFTAQAPAGTARIVPMVRMYQAPAAPYSYVFMTRAMLCEVSENCNVLVPFDFGAGGLYAVPEVNTRHLAIESATSSSQVTVATDLYTFPLSGGVQDRNFAAISYTNNTSAAVTVELTGSALRQLVCDAGQSGNAQLLCWVSVLNVTDSLLVSSIQDWMDYQLRNVAPGASAQFMEAISFSISVPAGKNYSFTPKARTVIGGGGTGNPVLNTYAYSLRLAALKR
jgi:hypothetical protein